jgi:hypothetical protein
MLESVTANNTSLLVEIDNMINSDPPASSQDIYNKILDSDVDATETIAELKKKYPKLAAEVYELFRKNIGAI